MFNLRKLAKNPYVFSVISKIFEVIVGLLFTIFQARYLGPEIKGQVATVNSMVGITSIVLGWGIYHAYPFFKRKSKVDLMPVFMRISLLLLIVYSSISIVAILFFELLERYIAVFVITPIIVYDGIISYLTLVEVPNKRSAIDIFVNFLELLILVILWKVAPPSFVVGIFVITVKSIMKAIFFTYRWRKKILVRSESIWLWIPKLFGFGFLPMLSQLMTNLNYRVDILMLNRRVPDSDIGVYSIGLLLAERIWMIPDAIKGVMISNITKGKDERETAFVIRVCNTICMFIVFGIVVFGKLFLNIVFGSEYQGAYQITLILLIGVFSMIYYKMIASYNIAMGKQRVNFILLGVGVISNIILNLILIPILGVYGAGIASVISYILCSVLFIIYFLRSTYISIRDMLLVNRSDIKKLITMIKQKKY